MRHMPCRFAGRRNPEPRAFRNHASRSRSCCRSITDGRAFRLACMTHVHADVAVHIPSESEAAETPPRKPYTVSRIAPQPVVSRVTLDVAGPYDEPVRPLAARIGEALARTRHEPAPAIGPDVLADFSLRRDFDAAQDGDRGYPCRPGRHSIAAGRPPRALRRRARHRHDLHRPVPVRSRNQRNPRRADGKQPPGGLWRRRDFAHDPYSARSGDADRAAIAARERDQRDDRRRGPRSRHRSGRYPRCGRRGKPGHAAHSAGRQSRSRSAAALTCRYGPAAAMWKRAASGWTCRAACASTFFRWLRAILAATRLRPR